MIFHSFLKASIRSLDANKLMPFVFKPHNTKLLILTFTTTHSLHSFLTSRVPYEQEENDNDDVVHHEEYL